MARGQQLADHPRQQSLAQPFALSLRQQGQHHDLTGAGVTKAITQDAGV